MSLDRSEPRSPRSIIGRESSPGNIPSREQGADLAASAVCSRPRAVCCSPTTGPGVWSLLACGGGDRKSTRLNSSHGYISYAVFCLKKKKKQKESELVIVERWMTDV